MMIELKNNQILYGHNLNKNNFIKKDKKSLDKNQ